jgi:hypothetical protein
MSLAEKNWNPITIHEMEAIFLQSERYRLFDLNGLPKVGPDDFFIIDNPDISDNEQNNNRHRMLLLFRAPLLERIPRDTIWYKVRSLTDVELEELYVIGRCGWDYDDSNQNDLKFIRDKNELKCVSARRPNPLKNSPTNWLCPILWGHDKSGPFTIIDGNNRLTEYVSSFQFDCLSLDIEVIIGLSSNPCYWHLLDTI